MKYIKYITCILITLVLTASFVGCDNLNGIMRRLRGEEENYTLTKGFTYSESSEPTEVYYVHTSSTQDGF